jgi:digalactosyldiacylglycerol synthase
VQDVPPLDLGELLAYFVKQSVPLFDQLGIKRGKMLDFCLQ